MTKRDITEMVRVQISAGRGTIEKIKQELNQGPCVDPGKKGVQYTCGSAH